ncbi:MAG: fibronectin type III domain-containing protein, partial [Frankiales bacterium]|nr:fibronectin type III domain-containing protein [Frankiales bacterium]
MRSRSRRAALLAVVVAGSAALTALAPVASAVTTPPGQPTNLTVQADDQAVFVAWQPPAGTGGAPVDYYQIIATDTAAATTTVQRTVTVSAPCARCTTAYVSGLVNGDSYVFTVAAHNSTGLGAPTAPSASVTPQHIAFLADSPPLSAKATISGRTATVTWAPPANTNNVPIDRYLVQMNDRTLTPAPGNVYYAGWKYACGTCTSVTFTGLSVGDSYDFFIYAHNNGTATATPVYGNSAGTNQVTATDPSCPSGQVCVSVDGASNDGPIAWRADGFLHGLDFANGAYNGPPVAMIQALHPTSWRVSGCTVPYSWQYECGWAAQNSSASLTDVLSDDYYGLRYDSNAKGMRPPWECWDCYTSDVQSIVTSTSAVSPTSVYWDLQNEPGFGLGPNQAGNYSLYLQQLLTAYQTVKAAVPTAKFVLP